ncbi:anthranilate 1,2-dioxygenase small subunit [Zoogloea sp.]|uniref:anthranilate 1,2-dioxygenase small subunit n=1 Tax=Zoogloea sp. TaxID=49181 RepID=UPI001416BD3E|nr:MAG: anthranilate 1,2-dioxygenase small subunit [Zoogloea sp.]
MGDLQKSVEQFLYRKAELCDRHAWDDYLELFDEGSEFHIPQWDSEHVYTTDPKRGMSMIYYSNRAGLEDRVFRIRTGKSAASTPLPRTLHLVSNVIIQDVSDSQLEVKAKWVTHYYRFGVASHVFGDVTYTLKPAGNSWVILRKHVVVMNDTIDAVLDFYHV